MRVWNIWTARFGFLSAMIGSGTNMAEVTAFATGQWGPSTPTRRRTTTTTTKTTRRAFPSSFSCFPGFDPIHLSGTYTSSTALTSSFLPHVDVLEQGGTIVGVGQQSATALVDVWIRPGGWQSIVRPQNIAFELEQGLICAVCLGIVVFLLQWDNAGAMTFSVPPPATTSSSHINHEDGGDDGNTTTATTTTTTSNIASPTGEVDDWNDENKENVTTNNTSPTAVVEEHPRNAKWVIGVAAFGFAVWSGLLCLQPFCQTEHLQVKGDGSWTLERPILLLDWTTRKASGSSITKIDRIEMTGRRKATSSALRLVDSRTLPRQHDFAEFLPVEEQDVLATFVQQFILQQRTKQGDGRQVNE